MDKTRDSFLRSAVWYFAYGANMSSASFSGIRKVRPIDVVPAVIDDYALSFDLLGVPYSEPAVANLIPNDSPRMSPVHGVAYLVSQQDLERIIATEGGGVAYRSMHARAKTITTYPRTLEICTLVARWPASHARRPSTRYLVRNAKLGGPQLLMTD
jgi:gliotoxin/aspirochlorine biosynthesis gamma-glutamylcyclotransferase